MDSWDDAAAFALTLPATALSTSYRQPAIKVDGKAFVSTGREPGSFHVRSPHDEKAVLMETDPATFWQTAHYANWPGLLIRFGNADPDRVRLVVTRAWWDAAKPATRRELGARP
ncbi:MmcQ/YjbR family DNA-binding protein [Sphingomonas sp.]|uniref:MmcQ/YjbR family DNA-binding protein n=1 Tax=Sphingomonas sp. TaxID=28214 RepID=UPI003CC55D30